MRKTSAGRRQRADGARAAGASEPAVHSITRAPEPLAVDQSRRERRYLIQMGIRLLCFVLAVVLWNHVPAWLSWLLIAGAVVLPYVAVLLANAGRERQQPGAPLMDPRAIEPGRTPTHEDRDDG